MNRAPLPSTRRLRDLVERLPPRQRQFLLLGTLFGGGLGLLWLVFALADSSTEQAKPEAAATPPAPTQIMPPGSQVDPVDQWVGTAGRKLADYEQERDRQQRLNQERQAFETRTLERFAELERRLTQDASTPAEPAPADETQSMPPVQALPPPPPAPAAGAGGPLPPGEPPLPPAPPAPTLTRITLAPPAGATAASPRGPETVTSFLPVGFTRGILLGGLDAPTGGQAQANPHPVLIRLSDNSVLPNRFRAGYRECFVVAAGYGDISSERAYLRTESLSCVREDGATLEVRIQGSVYGEDGKVGMRGRLVTKQGQMLANALLAGIVGGIGQGVATAQADYSTSALGAVSHLSGSDAYRAGLGTGVGRALDRLAQYYIKLAENTFPVIEVDAGREIDVVITKGVRIDVPMAASATPTARMTPAQRYEEVSDADD